jgi:integrase
MASKHPGVTLVKPKAGSGRAAWRATWLDPDTGKRVWVRLDPDKEGKNKETRERWAIRLYRELRDRRIDIEAGSPRSEAVPIAEAIERFYSAHPDLRGGTVRTYEVGTRRFEAWAKRAQVTTTADLTRRNLMKFRESVVNAPKRTAKFGGDRGQYANTGERRAPRTVNRELREVKRVLGYLRKCDLLARVTRDDLLDAFDSTPVAHERREHFSPKELQGVLEAAQRHDAANPDRVRPVDPIAPFVAFVLLTGMRLSEVLDLEWGDVKLDALDHSGKTVGEIHVRASATKTRKARTVDLAVSTALRKLLAAQRLRTGGQGQVFSVTEGTAKNAKRRLLDEYGAPKGFTWQTLRVTCGTFLVNAPGIYGSAAVFMESRQLGHSVTVAERDYVGLIRGIDPRLRTLEDAMQIKNQVAAIVKAAGRSRAA